MFEKSFFLWRDWSQLIYPILFIIGSYIIGLVVDKLILKKIREIVKKTSWKGDDVLINAVKGVFQIIFVLIGLYLATYYLVLDKTVLVILKKVILVLIIFFTTIFTTRVIVGFVSLYTSKTDGVFPASSIFINITKITILGIGSLIILQTFGISITPILTALGVGGLAVALALQDTLSNLFSGLQIIISKQVKLDDYVKLDSGEKGYVTDITWRNTTIRTLQNNLIVVPNSKLAGTILTNFNRPKKELTLSIKLGVSYESDLEKVEKVTLEVAKEVIGKFSGAVKSYKPRFRYQTFGDSSINFSVYLRVEKVVDQAKIKHEFIKRLYKRYQKEGIEIPYPVTTVHLKK